ncbi:MAG: S46 family peptidase [Gemmatimonadetes bacterium]|nr:S46 family peptidase [Gemmatimonadota bacterium]
MSESRIPFRRLSVLSVLLLGACATAQPQQPVPSPTPAAPAATTTEAWARAALVPPEPAVRSANDVVLKGTELGTMWTFEAAPVAYWQKTYGFTATPEWLDRVRLSSVKIPGCSASFVSENGLILTNHHCARGCVARNSTPERDYVTTGFYAATREDEKVCPGSYADVLTGIADITTQIRAAEQPGMTNAQIAAATQQAVEQATNACQKDATTICRVVPLFKGGQYQLYTYHRYAPVKLVMAPELQSGFFGGDYDNFVYPRYALDFSFLRAYEADGNTPIKSPNFFPFDPTGPDDGELIFVTGNPGSTARLITVAQLLYEKAFRHPMVVSQMRASQDVIAERLKVATGQELINLREQVFGIENTRKKYEGEVVGLTDTLLVATKIKWEQEFRARAKTTPAAQPYLDVWDKLYELQLRKLQVQPVLTAANPGWLGSEYLALAGNIVAAQRYLAMPEAQRPPQLRGDRVQQFQQSLTAPIPNPTMAQQRLAAQFRLALMWLPPNHPLRTLYVHAGETPAQAAQRVVQASKIGDPAFRQQLISGGAAAIKASIDPLVQLAVTMDSLTTALTPEAQAIAAEEQVQNSRLARALFAVYGNQLPPDATSTLRISDGIATGYAYNGSIAPYRTVFHGMYARAAEFNNVDPFNLPPKFADRKAAVNMDQPIDFVSTNDITGGNSGSPVIDKQARIIGLAFDGNMEQLPNEYVFRTETGGRTIAVFSGGILEALKSIYQAQALLAELAGGK